jgi:hypothetical protein
MPDADTVWLVELAELTALLHEVGLTVTWQEECSTQHRAMAVALGRAFQDDAAAIGRRIGTRAPAELIAAHELWSEWLGTGRVRKFAMVAEQR